MKSNSFVPLQNRLRAGIILATLLVPVFSLCASTARAEEDPNPVICAFPEELQATIDLRDQQLLKLIPGNNLALQYVIVGKHKRWEPGQSVRVAFNGGSPQLQADIAKAVEDWLQNGKVNLKLDFGHDTSTGKYRQWSSSDTAYAADIRIGFDQGGYWSLVGRDSSNPSIVAPGERSMNLGGFAADRPIAWRATTLHEFGHALGFHHEHQHPMQGCDTEFRWEDDAGYVPTTDQYGQYIVDSQGKRPGIYTVLGGPPNSWPVYKVDWNLRQIQNSHGFEMSNFDGQSIMKYYFPSWMFRSSGSHCVTGRNSSLSDLDKAGIIKAYSEDPIASNRVLDEQQDFLEEMLQKPQLAPALRDSFKANLDSLKSRE